MVTLGQVLSDPEAFPFDHGLFLAKDKNWHWNSVGVLSAYKDVSPEEETADPEAAYPDEARCRNLRSVLDLGTLQDIIANLLRQTNTPSDQLRLQAFHYYFRNDAFMTLEGAHS